MSTITRSLTAKPSFQNTVIVVLALFLIQIGFAAVTSAEQAAEVAIASGHIYVTPLVSGVTFMMLRVADPQGQMIFDQSSDGSPIKWSPPAGALDGI